jgi:hypothetical protein
MRHLDLVKTNPLPLKANRFPDDTALSRSRDLVEVILVSRTLMRFSLLQLCSNTANWFDYPRQVCR